MFFFKIFMFLGLIFLGLMSFMKLNVCGSMLSFLLLEGGGVGVMFLFGLLVFDFGCFGFFFVVFMFLLFFFLLLLFLLVW